MHSSLSSLGWVCGGPVAVIQALQDVLTPWDYNYKGARPASEPETRIIQGIIDRQRPICVIDFHTADYVMQRATRDDASLIEAIRTNIKTRLKDRFLAQQPYNGRYQQVNMDSVLEPGTPKPYLIDYAAKQGTKAAFLIEMSGNRDDVHALRQSIVDVALAALEISVPRLEADLAIAQLRKSLDAFARLDTERALEVLKQDDAIDQEFDGLLRKLITYMMEDPRTISSSIDLVFVAKAIERIGDHAKNLAEATIYVVKGTDVRHHTLEDVENVVR